LNWIPDLLPSVPSNPRAIKPPKTPTTPRGGGKHPDTSSSSTDLVAAVEEAAQESMTDVFLRHYDVFAALCFLFLIYDDWDMIMDIMSSILPMGSRASFQTMLKAALEKQRMDMKK
jgi:hypothetical protein